MEFTEESKQQAQELGIDLANFNTQEELDQAVRDEEQARDEAQKSTDDEVVDNDEAEEE